MATIIDAAKAGGKWRRKGWMDGHFWEFREYWTSWKFREFTGNPFTQANLTADDWEPVEEEPPQWAKDVAEEYCMWTSSKVEMARLIAKHWRKAGKP